MFQSRSSKHRSLYASGELKIMLTTTRTLFNRENNGLTITEDIQRWVYHYGLILQSRQKDTIQA